MTFQNHSAINERVQYPESKPRALLIFSLSLLFIYSFKKLLLQETWYVPGFGYTVNSKQTIKSLISKELMCIPSPYAATPAAHAQITKYLDILGPVNIYTCITVLKYLVFTYHPGVQFLLHCDHSKVGIPCTHLPGTTATLDDIQFLGSGFSTTPNIDFTGS